MLKSIFKFLAKYLIPISVSVAIIVAIVGIRFLIIRVSIDQVGVKTVIWGIKRGVVQKDYAPGWHRYIRQTETWDLYDVTVQTLNLTREALAKGGKIVSREIPIRTADDYEVTVDIIVKYQIKKGKAHRIRQEIGSGNRYKMFVESETKDVARNVLGKMFEKDLYDPDEKRKRADEAKKLLASKLEFRHVDIIEWLILDMRFDAQLERKIKNVKLAELDELLNIAKEEAAEQRGITQTIDADTEALAQKIQSDKEGQIVTLKSEMDTKVIEIIATANKFLIEHKGEGDHYKHVRIAAGELLVDKAKAIGERLRREAMSGLGGDLIVALEAARNINLKDVVVSTQDIDLLDIEAMTSKLGAGKRKVIPVLQGHGKRLDSLTKPEELPEELRLPKELEEEFNAALTDVLEELEHEHGTHEGTSHHGTHGGTSHHGAQEKSPQHETHEETPHHETHEETPQHKTSEKSHEMEFPVEWADEGLTKEYPINQ